MTFFFFAVAIICLIAAFIFRNYVRSPIPEQQSLSSQTPIFTSLDPQSSPLDQSLSASKARGYTESAKAHLEAAQTMAGLHQQFHAAKTIEASAPARLENELLTLENQNELLIRATKAGVSVADYSVVRSKALEGQDKIALQKEEIEATIASSFIVTDRRFARAKQLRQELLKLRLELEDTKTKRLPEGVRQAHIQDIKDQIDTLQVELKEQIGKAVVPEINGQELG